MSARQAINATALKRLLLELADAVLTGNDEKSVKLTHTLLNKNVAPKDILDRGLFVGMKEVGIRFRDNIIFIPEVLISTRAMKRSLALIKPYLEDSDFEAEGTLVMGTVKGDIHDIGKNIVTMILRGSGFKVVDLGINVSVEKFIGAIVKEEADIIGMSALLTTTMGYMQIVVERIKSEGIPVKTLVGGAPLSRRFANEIGADSYARNASEAVKEARRLLETSTNQPLT
ncbi:MAG: corrinoid protein [Fidelibacterota bacterium]